MLFATFHGGSGGQMNLAAYDETVPKLLTDSLLESTLPDAEWRGLDLVEPGLLWVANGSKSGSAIYACTGSGTSYSLGSPVVSYPTANSLFHPFDFTFSDDGQYCFVSNQDTNVVARFVVGPAYASLTPSPAPALPPGIFLDGTFVASSVGKLPHVPIETTAISDQDGGLDVTIENGKVTHSVRGVVWTNGALYVADEPGGVVRVYDADGNYLGASNGLDSPVHLLASNGTLRVSTSDGVYASTLTPGSPASLDFQLEESPPKPSGMAIDENGVLYVAERKTKGKINRIPSADGWPLAVDSEPEFVFYVPGDPSIHASTAE